MNFFLEKLQQQCKNWCYFLHSNSIEKHSQAIKLLLLTSYDVNNYSHITPVFERKSTPQYALTLTEAHTRLVHGFLFFIFSINVPIPFLYLLMIFQHMKWKPPSKNGHPLLNHLIWNSLNYY